jgi:hypothetical protein
MRHTAMGCFLSNASTLAQTQERNGPRWAVQNFWLRTSKPRAIFKFGIRNFCVRTLLNGLRHAISLSNAFASFRSSVSNPSVNRPKTGARSLRASSRPAKADKVGPVPVGGEVMCEAKASATACGRSNGQSDWRATPATWRRSRRCAQTSSMGAAWPPPRRASYSSK